MNVRANVDQPSLQGQDTMLTHAFIENQKDVMNEKYTPQGNVTVCWCFIADEEMNNCLNSIQTTCWYNVGINTGTGDKPQQALVSTKN